jgi:hypothetical protein
LFSNTNNNPRPSATSSYFYQDIYNKEQQCNLETLATIESNFNLTRLFFVSPDRKQKYLPLEEALIPSRTMSLYSRLGGTNATTTTTIRRLCSICVNGVWSSIDQDCTRKNVDIYYCSRDHLEPTGYSRIELEPGRMLDDSVSYQNLFEPGKVKVVYKLSETVELCRICEAWGEWSEHPTATFCHSHVAFFKANRSVMVGLRSSASQPTMRPCELRELDRTESSEYIRESIQTPNANSFVNETEEIVEDGAMAVYKTNQHQADLIMLNMKYCRRCSDGSWDFNYVACPVEFAIRKCEPSKLRGVNYFVYASDGSKVSESEKTSLVWPGKILAVYEFGVQKYCKTCSEDGVWSSYPQYQLCSHVNWT